MNKLDIADAQLYIIQSDQFLSGLHSGPEDHAEESALANLEEFKCCYNGKVDTLSQVNLLLVSFKTVYENQF